MKKISGIVLDQINYGRTVTGLALSAGLNLVSDGMLDSANVRLRRLAVIEISRSHTKTAKGRLGHGRIYR